MASETPELLVADAAAWRAWLDANEDSSDGVWVVLAKKGTTTPTSLTYDEALDEALCSGWIDGQVGRRDETTYKQRFTPRRARSPWSMRNTGHVARLVESGRIRPRGLAEVERAKADGRWDVAYDGQATIADPPDLLAALEERPRAKAMFAILTKGNRWTILYNVTNAKRSETRARRIEKYVDMLDRGETPNPQKQTLEP